MKCRPPTPAETLQITRDMFTRRISAVERQLRNPDLSPSDRHNLGRHLQFLQSTLDALPEVEVS